MKNLKNLFLLVMAGCLILASACNKDKNDPEDEKLACLLTKITWINDDSANDVTTLMYDADRRLVKITGDTQSEYMTIEYNTEGKISKIASYESDIEDWHTNLIWTSNSMTAISEYKDDGVWVTDDYKTVIEFDADEQITKIGWFEKNEDSWVADDYELFTWSNKNITKSEHWNSDKKKSNFEKRFVNRLFRYKGNSSLQKSVTDSKSSNTTYEYDDKNNAYASLGFLRDIAGLNKNNVTKEVYTRLGDNQYSRTTNYSYEYNDKGFPTKITETQTSSYGNTYTYVVLLEYDCQ